MRHHPTREPTTADDLQRLANVLDDTAVPRPTRRRLLQGAALGAASAGAARGIERVRCGRRRGVDGHDPL